MEFTVPAKTVPLTPTRSGPLPRVPKEGDPVSKSTPLPALANSGDVFLMEPESKKKSELARRQEEFRRLMALDDELIEDYSCAMRPSKQGVFVQGRLYISDKHISFGTIFLPEGKIIKYEDILRIRKRTTAYVFANAIDVVTTSEKIYFASFIYRDEAFDLIRRQWKLVNGSDLPASSGSDGDTTGEDETGSAGFPEAMSGSDSDGPEDLNPLSLHPLKSKMSQSSPAVPLKHDASTPTSVSKTSEELAPSSPRGGNFGGLSPRGGSGAPTSPRGGSGAPPLSPRDGKGPTKRKLFQKPKKKDKDGKGATTSDDSDTDNGSPKIDLRKADSSKDKKEKEKAKSASKDKKKKSDSGEEDSSPMSGESEGRARSKTISGKPKKKKFSIDNSSKESLKTRAKRSRSVNDSDDARPIQEESGNKGSDDDGPTHDLLSSSELELPEPPVADTHSLFHDEYKRSTIVQRELKCDLVEFYKLFWASRKFYDAFAAKLQYYDTSVTEWKTANPAGCFERKVGWSVALNGFSVGPKSVTVEQTQRVRFKNKFHMEIETSGRSIGVPFADNFTAEERWMVMTTSSGIKVIVEAGMHWSSVPWSASMLKGTIEGQGMKSSVANANLFLDMASEIIAQKQVGADERRKKRAGSKPRSQSVDIRPDEPAPAPASSPQPTIPPAETSTAGGSGIPSTQLLIIGGVLIFVILVLSLFVYGLSSRLSSLESQFGRISVDEHISSRVAFVEYFVSQMHKNLTGKAVFDDQQDAWLKSPRIKEQLSSLQDSIQRMIASIDSKESFRLKEQIALSEEALRNLEAKPTAARASASSSWFSFILYWLFIAALVVGVSYLIKLAADGKLKLKRE